MIGKLAANVGVGLVAGLAGTTVMTAAQMAEMRLSKRPSSPTPAKAVEKVFSIRPVDEEAENRLNWVVHFGYGTTWGACRGLLGAFGLRGPAATALHWASVQSTEYLVVPRLGLAPPVTKWGAKAVFMDMAFHVIYAISAGLVFDTLHRDVEKGLIRRDETTPPADPRVNAKRVA